MRVCAEFGLGQTKFRCLLEIQGKMPSSYVEIQLGSSGEHMLKICETPKNSNQNHNCRFDFPRIEYGRKRPRPQELRANPGELSYRNPVKIGFQKVQSITEKSKSKRN